MSNGLLTLTFNRPESRNAIPTDAVLRLAALFRAIGEAADVRVVLVRGKGENFGGGGDVAGMRDSLALAPEARSQSYYARLDNASEMVKAWCAIPQPIVAACRGSVAGAAMMFSLGADFTFGDPTTYFLCAHRQIGLTPDSGLSYLLPRVVGLKRATDLILSARKVDAPEALAIGLLSQICAAEDLDAFALKQAQALAAAPQLVVRRAKALLAASLENGIGQQLDAERDLIAQSVADPDFEEGITAFFEKRRAKFPSAR
ncbi:enoyl-CoA hydratase/isomerase family protein [Rhizorhabdus argentea]|uniref:enoyl-CoA hydratase/isomerase family protein n=1 Tax=Rhizorhabdus argentea TaxID=1387174 RepID=UPI0030EC3A47